MHRRALLSLLDRYEILHSDESECVCRIRALVEQQTDCFERDCLPGHITASVCIVSSDRSRCLLTHHRKLDRWQQLGGHADGDSNVMRVAEREAREESGLHDFTWICGSGSWLEGDEPLPLDIDVHQIPARKGEVEHEHHDIRFLLIAEPGQEIQISDESNDLAWFLFDELPGLGADESLLRLARKAQALMHPKA